jgi:lipopolysaccharide/colanic/teichoic acid biosynthesis glycosyltransferase
VSVAPAATRPASPGRPGANELGFDAGTVVLTAVPLPRRRGVYSFGLSVVGAWQQANRTLVPIVADLAVVLVVMTATAVPGGLLRVLLVSAAAVVVGGLALGLYRHRSVLETQGIGWFPIPALLTCLALGASLCSVEPLHYAAHGAGVVLLAMILARAALWVVLGHARRHGHGLKPALIVGPPERVAQLRRRLEVFPDAGLYFAGGFTPQPDQSADPALEALEYLSARHDTIQVLVVADGIPEEILREVARYAGPQVDCAVVPPVGALCGTRLRHRLGDLGVIPVFTRPSWGHEAVKRITDLTLASVALLLCWPVLAVAALAVRHHDHGPALFRQERVGRGGRIFTVLKFRTMDLDAEARKDSLRHANVVGGLLFKLAGDPRVTPVGELLRRTAIDELPQLFNVIRGDMSLVGPRPLPAVADDFDDLAQIRHEVGPGMTGLWQVRGGNALPYKEMLDLDLAYVLGRSFGLDLKIMLQTVPALLVRRSVY